jgi:hypothetical protein
MSVLSSKRTLKVADEVWISTALLHRRHPEQADFSVEEIVENAKKTALVRPFRPGVYVHAIQHCVANRPPNPGRYRVLFETAPGRRRLFRRGDSYHPGREGGKVTPAIKDMPDGYEELLAWYEEWRMVASAKAPAADPLLSLRGSGKHLWAKEHADDYVRRLREGWE